MKLGMTNLSKSYHMHPVLNIAACEFGAHGVEGLIGPNGAGKSTLMGLLTRRIAPTSGDIRFEVDETTHRLNDFASFEVARMGLIKSNQRIQNFDSLGIRDSLRLAATPHQKETLRSVFSRVQTDVDIEAEIAGYLEIFPFADPDGLAKSGGEKKLLDILRCLIAKPRMLLMDEPAAGLPDDIAETLMKTILERVERGEMTIVIVEHDLELIWKYCGFVHFLSEGELLFQGPPDKVKKNRVVAEKYMGV